MSDARRAAEIVLAADYSSAPRGTEKRELRAALRALLAEAVATPRSMTADEGAAYGDVLDGMFKPAPPPASDEVREAAEALVRAWYSRRQAWRMGAPLAFARAMERVEAAVALAALSRDAKGGE